MTHLQIADLENYCALVVRSEHEMQCLAAEVAVPETWFFRYPASFEFLQDQLVARRRESSQRLVIASLGCATGVEPWCIAACALSAGWRSDQVKVHAIDRSPFAIESAKCGRIPGGSLRSPLPEWSDPWIRANGSTVVISQEVLNCVEFRQQDILTTVGLFAEPIDVLFCRNVMIYLDASARIALRDRIVGWIAKDGLVFFGHADGLERGTVLESAGVPSAFAWRRRVALPANSTPLNNSRQIGRSSPDSPAVSPRVSSSAPRKTQLPIPPTAHPAIPTAQSIRSLIVAMDFDSAKRALDAKLAADPANTELLELLAGVHSAQGELVPAIQAYSRVVYLEPSHGPALLALAELSAALGRTEDASRYRARMKRLGDS